MASEVRKINHLKNLESFIQVNLFKGYSYTDKEGEIINSFYQNNKPPQFVLGLDGLTFTKPDDITEEMKVTPEALWTRYINPVTLDRIANAHLKKLEIISKILNVEAITRVGWRNYFIYEYQSENDRNKAFQKFSVGQSLRSELSIFTLKIKKTSLKILIRKVNKNNTSRTPSMLIDIDAFEDYKDLEQVTKSRYIITRIRQVIQSDDLLKEIKQIIK